MVGDVWWAVSAADEAWAVVAVSEACEQPDKNRSTMVRVWFGDYEPIMFVGQNLFPTRAEAVAKAEELRDLRVAALEADAQRLRELTF